VCLGSLDADSQCDRNFLAALALSQKLDDLALSTCQATTKFMLDRWGLLGIATAKSIEHHVAGFGGEKGALYRKSFDRSHQIAIGIGLHDVSARAGFHDVMDELIREMQRQDDNFRFRKLLADPANGFQTIELRHTYIHNDDIGFVLLSKRHGFAAIFRLGTNFPARLGRQQLLQTPPNDVVIVGN
jgi:hypothetical protein